MVNWELLERGQTGGGQGMYGPDWYKLPCVSLNKTGLSLNRPFMDAFHLNHGAQVAVLFDVDSRRIGLKVILPEEDAHGSFPIKGRKDGSHDASSLIACSGLSRRFPDCHKMAFRAHLDGPGRVIEIDLSPSNRVRG